MEVGGVEYLGRVFFFGVREVWVGFSVSNEDGLCFGVAAGVFCAVRGVVGGVHVGLSGWFNEQPLVYLVLDYLQHGYVCWRNGTETQNLILNFAPFNVDSCNIHL